MSDGGQTVLITGASSGIGATTARHLADHGFRVFGTSRRERESSDGVRFVVMDVCDDDSVRKGVEAVLAEAGRLDAVICNAGNGIFGSVEEVSIEAAKDQFETNFFGALRVLRETLPHLRKQGSGRILLVGSLAGRTPIPFQGHYSASKAAIDALAGSLANEVKPFGIRVVLIEPGDINTPFNDAMDWSTSPPESAYAGDIERCEQTIRENLPKSPGPEHVARAIERALRNRRPKPRYTVGAETPVVPIGKRVLPERFMLDMIRRHFGLD